MSRAFPLPEPPLMVHNLLDCSMVNGPGKRAVVFVQGCSLGCSECWNPLTWAGGGTPFSKVAIVAWLSRCIEKEDIEGLTISGGEAIQQIHEVLDLVRAVRRELPQLSIGMFSGYSAKELREGNFTYRPLEKAGNSDINLEGWRCLRRDLDWAVLGRYNKHLRTDDPMLTSKNQELRIYTDRYSAADFGPLSVEVTIGESGLVQLSGFPTKGNII